MSDDKDFIHVSPIRIQPDESETFSDALYSNPIDEPPNSNPFLTPRFYPPEDFKPENSADTSGNSGTLEPKRSQDSVSTGTFGNLVKRASNEPHPEDRVGRARQRIRYNLLRVGPKKSNSTDRCEAWRKYLF